MAELNYSRQRESIRSYLASTKEHPTADMVYLHVREAYPNISLATVYRNLNLLSEIGEVVKIQTPEGGIRFDGNVTPHDHVVCTTCGKVSDLMLSSEISDRIDANATSAYGGRIHGHAMIFRGTCSECLHI